MRYRIFPFDANDRPLQVLDVEDPVRTPGYSHSVPLPLSTAYISITPLEINDKPFRAARLHYSAVKILIYLLSTAILTLLEGLMFQQCLIFMADLLFRYSDVVSVGYGYTLFRALGIGTVYALIVLFTHFIKGSRIVQ